MKSTTTTRVRVGLAAVTVAGVVLLTVGCSATGGSLADQIQPMKRVAKSVTPVAKSVMPEDIDRATAAANPANADKLSEITATITNNTDMSLTKVSATHTGTGVHWQQQAPGTLAPHSTTTVTDYAGGNNKIDLTFQDSTGATYSFEVDDPFGAKDSVKGSTTSTINGVNGSAGSGFHDDSSFTVYVG